MSAGRVRSQCFTVKCSGRVDCLETMVNLNDPLVNPLSSLEKQPSTTVVFNNLLNCYKAIWDTGATNTCISEKVVADLGLQPIGVVQVKTAAGTASQNQYVVDILLPNKVAFLNMTVTGCQISGCDLLIGMDIIGSGDFAVTLKEGRTIFSYRHPTNGHIDFVEEQRKAEAAMFNSGRNNLCGCNSGKKYKDCHGKDL